MRDYILLYINGVRREISAAHAYKMFSDYLRYDLQANATRKLIFFTKERRCGTLKC